jgi:hypothetical protein
MFLLGFPLLLVPFAIYNMIAFLMPGVSFTEPLFTLDLLSQARLAVSLSDVLILFAMLILFIEILKATRIGNRSIVDHLLSLILFVVMLGEFVMVAKVATSTFLLLLGLSALDVLAGFAVTLRTSQRDITLERVEPV